MGFIVFLYLLYLSYFIFFLVFEHQAKKNTKTHTMLEDRAPVVITPHMKMYHAFHICVTYLIRIKYQSVRDYFIFIFSLLICISIYAFFMVDPDGARAWMGILTTMMIQNVLDITDMYVFPVWFMVYPTAPLILCTVIENLALIGMFADDEQSTLFPPWIDAEFVRNYPSAFETYMCLCCVLCIEGGGIKYTNCMNDLYIALIGAVFVATERLKIKSCLSRSMPMIKLPASIIKASYLLYAPITFWPTILLLICMNVCMLRYIGWIYRCLVCILIIVLAVASYQNHAAFFSCPISIT